MFISGFFHAFAKVNEELIATYVECKNEKDVLAAADRIVREEKEGKEERKRERDEGACHEPAAAVQS